MRIARGYISFLQRRTAHRARDLICGKRLADEFLCKLNRRERAQAEKVHLQQTDLLASRTIPLCHCLLRATGRATKRNNVVKRPRGNDHTRCMHALVACVILKSARVVEDASNARIS